MTVYTSEDAVMQAHAHPAAPELAIVIPTYNEYDNVEAVLRAIEGVLGREEYEVIFVDDDSPDGTMSRIREIASYNRRVRGIRRVGRRGLAGAVVEGMLATSAPIIAVMDCDLQHDETLLLRMLESLRAGDDLAIATRYMPGGRADQGLTRSRESGSRVANWLASTLLKQPVRDPMSGFFMLRRSLCESVAPQLSSAGFKVLLDILASYPRPLKICELPFDFKPRMNGTSKLDGRIVSDFLGLLVSKWTRNLVSPRFLMFGLVGASGLLVHLAALRGLHPYLPFAIAQLAASYVAMLSNFILNNMLTYNDRRLRGWQAVRGFISFALVCSVGTVANVGVAKLIYAENADWLFAGVAGALMAAVFNYAMTSVLIWRSN